MRSPCAILVFLAVGVAGCGPARSGPAAAVPVLSPDAVLAAHNAWADSVRHIWARALLRLNVPTGEADGDRSQYDLDGHLFVEKPDRLFVHGHVLGQEVFSIGMNSERFWMWVRPQVNTVWTGVRGGPGEKRAVIPPAELMAALGVDRIQLPAATPAQWLAQDEHYVLDERRAVGGAAVPRRRIWFDRRTLRPVRIDLFDPSGRCCVMAELLRYQDVGGTPLCTVYRGRFYADEEADEVDMVVRLTGVRIDKKPNPRLFEYRLPEGAKEVDLDRPALR